MDFLFLVVTTPLIINHLRWDLQRRIQNFETEYVLPKYHMSALLELSKV